MNGRWRDVIQNTIFMIFIVSLSLSVAYSGEVMFVLLYTESIYTQGKLKSTSDHGGNRTYDLWNASPMLCQLSYVVRSVRVCDTS